MSLLPQAVSLVTLPSQQSRAQRDSHDTENEPLVTGPAALASPRWLAEDSHKAYSLERLYVDRIGCLFTDSTSMKSLLFVLQFRVFSIPISTFDRLCLIVTPLDQYISDTRSLQQWLPFTVGTLSAACTLLDLDALQEGSQRDYHPRMPLRCCGASAKRYTDRELGHFFLILEWSLPPKYYHVLKLNICCMGMLAPSLRWRSHEEAKNLCDPSSVTLRLVSITLKPPLPCRMTYSLTTYQYGPNSE